MSDSSSNGSAGAVLSAASVDYLEQQFARFQDDPASVPDADRRAFEQMLSGLNGEAEAFRPGAGRAFVPSEERAFPRRSVYSPAGGSNGDGGHTDDELELARVQERLDQLVRNHRVRGHMMARFNPLADETLPPPELDPGFYGFTEADMNRQVSTSFVGGPEDRTIKSILKWLRETYCRSVGVQFMHIDSVRVRNWLQDRMESTGNRKDLPRETQLRVLGKLASAVVFEEFLLKKYQGAKTFSLEGAETLIPLLDLAIERCAQDGVREIVIGMAHRGRLNVLANVMGKHPQRIFREFEDRNPEQYTGRGDVKYHLGYSSDYETMTGEEVHLSLCFNPSHLEFVNTVALGRMRAKQDRFEDSGRDHGAVILIHGDSAFIGEGVVQETLNLSELPGYRVGGCLHVIVNNQIGFTTGPDEARSTTYATDVAKMLQIPIFHVNGEDPEAVAQALEIGLEFRKEFQKDVIIDMYAYRRRGHNENDEPAFTQPLMYEEIRARENVYRHYRHEVEKLGEVTGEEIEAIVQAEKDRLEQELSVAREDDWVAPPLKVRNFWEDYRGGPVSNADEPETAIDAGRAADLLRRQTELPEGFTPHKTIERFFLKQRAEMAAGDAPLNWAAAEAVAFASLLEEDYAVRLSGQDCERGTFSQRHTVLHDFNNGRLHVPLREFETEHAHFEVLNSPLSEAGVLGFEYGYSLDRPDGLVMWEAQFGDFVNAAQVIIDQFISSAEDKWSRLSGLVMLLPHGFEGQGPEHSSARLERFLQQCAEDNMIVAQPSTPAQYFHMLRRQTLRRWKKPLVVMTPKSLLRLPEAASPLSELAEGHFRTVIGDDTVEAPRKIVMCSGKVYYELLERRAEDAANADVAVVRMEEFYPLPVNELGQVLSAYPDGTPVVWCQDEPENMGAWRFLKVHYGDTLFGTHPLSCVCRPESASPATGSPKSHKQEQARLLDEAFA